MKWDLDSYLIPRKSNSVNGLSKYFRHIKKSKKGKEDKYWQLVRAFILHLTCIWILFPVSVLRSHQ